MTDLTFFSSIFRSYNLPLLLIIIIALLFVIIDYFNYKKGAYFSITKFPYWFLRFDVGRYGEYQTYKVLNAFEKEGAKFLFNLYIPKENGQTTEIDVLMICRKGIFVFESKNYSGWIFGSENQKNWYQTLPSGKNRSHKEHFYNPIMQNRTYIKNLKTLIGDDISTFSVIVFSERCTLKSVSVKSDDVKVVKRDCLFDLVCNICSNSSEILDENKVTELYELLYPYTQVTEEEKEKHVQDIKNNILQE